MRLPKVHLGLPSLHCHFPLNFSLSSLLTYESWISCQENQLRLLSSHLYSFFFFLHGILAFKFLLLLALKSSLYIDPTELPKVLHIISTLKSLLVDFPASLKSGTGECLKWKDHGMSGYHNEFPIHPWFCSLKCWLFC